MENEMVQARLSAAGGAILTARSGCHGVRWGIADGFVASETMLNLKDAVPFLQQTALWWNPILAGFVGAFGVHLLTQSRDREKWILDCKKQEYRELLSALSESYSKVLFLIAIEVIGIPSIDPDDMNTLRAAQDKATRTFRDRIYVVKDLDLIQLSNRWIMAMQHYERRSEAQRLHDEYGAIRDEILAAANRAVPKTTLQRLAFWKKN
jgi:hypothetical protein